MVKKVPDLIDHFASRTKNLLSDRNHGVLLAATTLISDMVQIDPNCLNEFRNVSVPLESAEYISHCIDHEGCSSVGESTENASLKRL